jgi:hypothetical protein
MRMTLSGAEHVAYKAEIINKYKIVKKGNSKLVRNRRG